MAYLDDHPPARSQFRRPRRAEPSGVVVVHTAESTPDVSGPDTGAENVAQFIVGRTDPGSYHDITDSDSAINLVGYDAEAFHDATGSNPHSYGVSAATRADRWPSMSQAWRDGCVYQMAAAAARYAAWLRTRSGIVIPARRITRSESELRMPGFISHAERDPTRRTDPGAHFPWNDFLAIFAGLTTTSSRPTNQEDEVFYVRASDNGAVALGGPGYWHHLNSAEHGAVRPQLGRDPSAVTRAVYDNLRAACLHGERAATDATS